ncbi:MAG: class I SAM-dependent rRNA methyltransferase [Candidatus Hydrogenedentes bacterium]|nr:class I SAM-dependent rRNA methyltransferase [Candidatus Hydrogenedentota bacterium]
MHRARLKANEERRLLRGHLWAYRNEFESLPELADGALVDVYSHEGRFVGRGFYQAQGGIAVRVLSRHQITVDEAFFESRIGAALDFRRKILPDRDTYRWVFAESDGLPGLVADRYGAVVVAQSSCRFYEAYQKVLLRTFSQHESGAAVRLDVCGQTHSVGNVPERVEVTINDVVLACDLVGGQKTGLFLDQQANWRMMETYARDARVLDGHCYIGAWSCFAAGAGARSVLGVDTSASAVELAHANAERNGLSDCCYFERADLAEVLSRGERYDVIVLDPPALATSRTEGDKSLALYRALNREALRAIEPGGFLITCSCSHFVDAPTFLEVLKRAARAAQRDVWILEMRGAAPDHPVLMSMPETAYLKCVVLRVL